MRFGPVRTFAICAVVFGGVGVALVGASLAADAQAPAPTAEESAPAVGQTTDAMAYINACQQEVTNLTRTELGQRAQNMTNQALLVAAYKRIKELEDAAEAAKPAVAPKAKTTK
jgi:hypothetical protein